MSQYSARRTDTVTNTRISVTIIPMTWPTIDKELVAPVGKELGSCCLVAPVGKELGCCCLVAPVGKELGSCCLVAQVGNELICCLL